jgi:hypothetical protein
VCAPSPPSSQKSTRVSKKYAITINGPLYNRLLRVWSYPEDKPREAERSTR